MYVLEKNKAKIRPVCSFIFCYWLSCKYGNSCEGRWGVVMYDMDQAGAEKITSKPGLTPGPMALCRANFF